MAAGNWVGRGGEEDGQGEEIEAAAGNWVAKGGRGLGRGGERK